jgi:endogenous inhibitor of DNA gyrase (YacG/DUF329 family)
MKCIVATCEVKLTPDQITFCSHRCQYVYLKKLEIFRARHAKQIQAVNEDWYYRYKSALFTADMRENWRENA